MAVAVKCPESQEHPQWCRGEIISTVRGQGVVEVYLVDYGHKVSVSWANLRKLQHQFISLECQARLKIFSQSRP